MKLKMIFPVVLGIGLASMSWAQDQQSVPLQTEPAAPSTQPSAPGQEPAAGQEEEQPLPPDIIYVHGNFYTNTLGPNNLVQRAEALAVRDGIIINVGSNDYIRAQKGPATKEVDLGGHFAVPGFNDAHVHLAEAGLEKLNLDLVGVKSLAEMQKRIRDYARKTAAGAWIAGGGWDHTLWPVQTLPSRADIDKASGNHPVLLWRVDGHIALANTEALRRGGITDATKDPQGGKIDRDADGHATGILRETACDPVESVIPKPTHARRRQAIELALRDAAQWGVTSLQDNSTWEDFQIYEELEKEGKLTARITEWLRFDDPLETLKAHRAAHSPWDNMLHTGMLKGFLDGSLGSRTAALQQPYADDPKNSGLARYDQATLNEMTRERADASFQIGFHAIGDRGVQMALDAYTEAFKDVKEKKVKGPVGSSYFAMRVEHAQVTTPAEVTRFGELNIIASMQPSHLLTDMRWAQDRLGPERAAHSYAWGEFLAKGVTLAFGTDYPVEPINPFRGLYAAITRKSEDGTKEYFPGQKLNFDQAMHAYTIGSATAEFAALNKGKILPDMLADFAVLDRDVTQSTPEEILHTKVLRTVVGGKTVYEAK